MEKEFASDLSEKSVVDANGRMIGQFEDLQFNSQTGGLEQVFVTKTGETNPHVSERYPTDEIGRFVIPTHDVQSVDDCIVVSPK